jgi:hypothetical protein
MGFPELVLWLAPALAIYSGIYIFPASWTDNDQGHWWPTADHTMLWFFIFIIFNLEHKWTLLMLCPLRNTFRNPPKSYERYFYIFISAMCERIWKRELKQFWALRKKEAKCVGIWETKTMGKYLKLWELGGCSSHLFRNLHFPGILNWQWSRSLATDGWSHDVMIFYKRYFPEFYRSNQKYALM